MDVIGAEDPGAPTLASSGLLLLDAVTVGSTALPVWGREGGRRRPGGAAPGGSPVAVLHLPGEGEEARAVAADLRADAVVGLPEGGAWLSGLTGPPSVSPLMAVVGAVGGVGATTVALACAAAAGSGCLLVDADRRSAGLDLPLGIPNDEGGRWDSVPDTAGALVADTMRSALPRVQGVSVLTGALPEPTGDRLAAVVDVGRSGFRRTVVDCGRAVEGLPLGPAERVVLVTPATLSGVVSTHRLLGELPDGSRCLLAVRATGWLPVDEVADRLGVDTVVEVPRIRRLTEALECGEALQGRVGRDLTRLGHRIWEGLP